MSEVRASFDVSTKEGKMKVYNAKNGASVSMKDLDNDTIIECTGVMQYEELVESYGQQQESTVTVLFGKGGKSFASISDTVKVAGESLIELVVDLELDEFNVRLVKLESKAGREFLNLQLVTE